ncbi:sensor histidine kinase [Streptomyces zagrosensis]|nr:histidine kinase [Streptomyces zagrosensis]
MNSLFRPLTQAVTYTRWLHMLVGGVFAAICLFVFPGVSAQGPLSWAGFLMLPVPLLIVLGLVPVVRLAEGVQARLMLMPGRSAQPQDDAAWQERPGLPASVDRHGAAAGHGRYGLTESDISLAPARTWADRGRTVLWLLVRVLAGTAVLMATVWLPVLSGVLIAGPGGWFVLLVPLPLAALAALVVVAGATLAQVARWLLAPSADERLAVVEERTERLLEHNRLARELHDSIGHALTIAVVQAGAARLAGSAEFTERALVAIEDTGRRALGDLERVLRLLRQDSAVGPQDIERRPALTDVERLLESARAAGAPVDAEVTGAVEQLPGPLSREGYRIVQESLTNVLRHAGPVPVAVRVAVSGTGLELDVRNPLPTPADHPADGGSGLVDRGSGLRNIRERATLLGGDARTGPEGGQWRVHVCLPLDRLC